VEKGQTPAEKVWSMTFPTDRNLDRPAGEEVQEKNVTDRLPPNERGQDEERTEIMRESSIGGSRPLTGDERSAAERDVPLRERVYAPASERVPKEPVPGHREMVEHTDPATPERQAATSEHIPNAASESSSEPPFTRVQRPSTAPTSTVTPTPTPTPYASATSNPAFEATWDAGGTSGGWLPRGMGSLGWLVVPACAAIGVWFWMRRRREENKPINRLRRQARHTAAEIRDHVPNGTDLAQPALGVMAAVVSTSVMIWRQMQRQRPGRALKRAGQQASKLSDADWQKRLNALKERWHPGRLELEKISISRH
jgi:hypothetical protein